jgi:hypothetical protein
MTNNRGIIYTTPGLTQQRFESLLAKNYIGIGQIVGEELTNENIKDKKQTYTQQGTNVVLFRYKVRLCTKIDDTIPNDQCIFAFGQNNGPSGKGGFYFGNWRYPDGEFVEVYQHPVTGLYYIDNSVPVGVGVTLTQDRSGTQGCKPLSGYKPGNPTFQVSLANQGKSGGPPINETSAPHTHDFCKWDDLYLNMPIIELKTPCEPSSMAGVPSAISGLLKDVQNLRNGLLGNDSFLVTSQEFVNEVQSKVDGVASIISGAVAWLIQEIKKQILRLINTTVNSTVGAVYLNTRYQIFEGVDAGTKAINCAFEAILNSLAQFISDALNNLINDVLSATTCAIENFLSEVLSQIVNAILSAISGILAGISGIIGAAINVIDTILGVVESLLNLFEGCPPKQICPADKEWNFIEGSAGSGTYIDINGIFNRVNSAVSSVNNFGQAITDFPTNFDNFDFNLDPNAPLASANGCFVGASPCGPPVVRFFGGGAIRDALGRAVVGSSGGVIGIDIIDPGFGYSSSPMVVINDPCGVGIGARAIAEIGPISVSDPDVSQGGGLRPRTIGPGQATSPTSTGALPVSAGTTSINCLYPANLGYNGPGVYLDLSEIASTVNVFFDVTVNAQYSLTIPQVGTIDQNSSDFTVSLAGGKIYGPCTVLNGTLYVGNSLVNGIPNSGTLPDTCAVVGNPGVEWNTFFVRTSRGKFVDLIDCNSSNILSVGVTTVPIISTGFNYLSAPDGSRGANGLVYNNRCQTLVQRANNTWDQPYNPGEVITLETGDVVSFPGLNEIEIGNTTQLPKPLIKLGAYVVRINQPAATVSYKSMVGFVGVSSSGWFSANDYEKAKSQGYSDADVRFYLEKNFVGRISPKVQAFLNDPTWGRLVNSPDTFSPKSMISFNERTYGPTGFDLSDLNYAKSLGYRDSDVRFFLENTFAGKISPNMQKFIDDPGWGRTPIVGYTGIRQMFNFDDSVGGKNFFGYKRDYVEAKRRGYSDADIRYYLENHYKGEIGKGMQDALNDPNFGRIQGISNMAGVEWESAPRDMTTFGDSYGTPGTFGNEDYQQARRQGYTDSDIRFYLEKHYTGTIGATIRVKLNDPAWGRVRREFEFYDDVGNSSFGIFGILDYEVAKRQIDSDTEFLNSDTLYEQFVQEGYTDADIRYYLENYYRGTIGPLMKAKLDDPNWGRELSVIPLSTVGPLPRVRSMIGFSDSTERRDEFSLADLETAKKRGFKDVDVRFFLENNYSGFVADPMRRLLSDPNWGRLEQTVTISVTAPGCPEETVIDNFISTSEPVTSSISDIIISDPGFNYDSNDEIVIIPENGSQLEYELTNGSISSVRVVSGGGGFTDLPEIRINTNTGYNARLIPVLKFNRVGDENTIGTDVGIGTETIRIVDCVGRIPTVTPFEIVPE